MKELFVVWLIAAMNMMSPAHRNHFVPEARESYVQADARYKEIAEAIIKVAFDPAEKSIFGGQYGRSKTALFIAHKFYMESGYRRDIQNGIGRERLASQGYNDFGRSWCLGQINLGVKKVNTGNGKWTTDSAALTQEGWSGRELLDDIEKCVRATLHIMHRSLAACSHLPFEERLAAYAAGTCDSERGRAISKSRYFSFTSRWRSAWLKHPHEPDININKEAPKPITASVP